MLLPLHFACFVVGGNEPSVKADVCGHGFEVVVSARVLGLGKEYTLRRRNATPPVPSAYRYASIAKPKVLAFRPLPETSAVSPDPREGWAMSHLLVKQGRIFGL